MKPLDGACALFFGFTVSTTRSLTGDFVMRQILSVNGLSFVGLHVVALATVLTAIVLFFLSFSSKAAPEFLVNSTSLTWTAVALFIATYSLRTFGLTAGFHRYFAHRTYKTSRWFGFVLAWLGCSAIQKGPLWWAGTHRVHHDCSDTHCDPHSPLLSTFWHGVWESHVGWILAPDPQGLDIQTKMKDFYKHGEIRWLEKYHWFPGVLMALACYFTGGVPGLLWGFIVSTIAVYHGTFMVNSVCHLFGTRRFNTDDGSRNNWFVALLTFGEGWHNNHHHDKNSARQGIKWWEYDISYYGLWTLSKMGIVWELKGPSQKKLPSADPAEALAA